MKLIDRWQARLERAGARHQWLALSVKVQRRFGDERGANLAAAISMRAFLSLFPVLVLAIAFVGFIGGDPHTVATDIVDALGLSGHAASTISRRSGSSRASSSTRSGSSGPRGCCRPGASGSGSCCRPRSSAAWASRC